MATKRKQPAKASTRTIHDPIAVTVDVALVTAVDGGLQTLLVEREAEPFRGVFALPGGFVREGESLEATAARVLRDKAAVDGVFLEQLYTFGSPNRDPRMRIVTVAYYALVDAARFMAAEARATAARTARLSVPWDGETGGPVGAAVDDTPTPLAFDHEDILGMVVKRMRGKLDYSPIGFQLLPQAFTLRDLQVVHETVLGTSLNKDSFRRRMLASGQLEATGERQADVGHRPAELYRFVRRSAV
ncbi:MAG: NUDIX hydrolase [Myxococcales bacterium]|nr:NUDIX hydrolase [Myxococcales bacterium]